MMVDPRWLKSKVAQHETVDDDRPCAKCSYNLRGLKRSARCPECGTYIDPNLHTDDPDAHTHRGAKSPKRPEYIHLSIPQLKRVAIATNLMYFGALIMMSGLAINWGMLALARLGNESIEALHFAWVFSLACIPGATLWFLGCLCLTFPTTKLHAPDVRLSRIIHHDLAPPGFAQLAQLGSALQLALPISMALAAASAFMGGFAGGEANHLIVASSVLGVIACIAAAPIMLTLRNLSMWANDDNAFYSSITCAFGLPLGGAWIAYTPALNEEIAFGKIIGLGWAFIIFAFAFFIPWVWIRGLASIANVCRWAPRNQQSFLDRQERFIQRAKEQARKTDEIRQAHGGYEP